MATDLQLDLSDASRKYAKFTGAAYATGIFKLNRDDPQFYGVPDLKFMVEGQAVHRIEGSVGNRVLSASKYYSNSPPLCLLDYLINTVYGRGLDVKFIDLESFYQATKVCDKIMLTGRPKLGEFWKNVSGDFNVKRFECNLSLATDKPIRDNVELILETMSGAELIWSGGKYVLKLIYPVIFKTGATYERDEVVQYDDGLNIDLYRSTADGNTTTPPGALWSKDVVSAYITDDDILRGNDNKVVWPNASSRYNYLTIKYLNEAKDFTEDTVSWPPKSGKVDGPSIDRGEWSSVKSYNVSDIVTASGKQYQLCSGGSITFSDAYSPTVNYIRNNRVLYLGEVYKCTVDNTRDILPTVTDNWVPCVTNIEEFVLSKEYLVGETVYYSGEVFVCKTTSLSETPSGNAKWENKGVVAIIRPGFDVNWLPYNDNTVYKSFITEDNGLPLETEIFETGTTDYWHALAKAEQRVRTSRNNTIYSLRLAPELYFLEAGDVIHVTSEALQLPGILLRIESFKFIDDGAIEIDAYRLEASTLAWNVDDNQVVVPRNIFDDSLAQATNLRHSKYRRSLVFSSGVLYWDSAKDVRVKRYSIRRTSTPKANITENTVWTELGKTTGTSFEIPAVLGGPFTFMVVSESSNKSAPFYNEITKTGWPKLQLYFGDVDETVPVILDPSSELDKGSVRINWEASKSKYLKGYEFILMDASKPDYTFFSSRELVRHKVGDTIRPLAKDAKPIVLAEGVTDNFVEISSLTSGDYLFGIKTVLLNGDVSYNTATLAVTIVNNTATNVKTVTDTIEMSISPLGTIKLTFDAMSSDPQIKGYELRIGESFISGTKIAVTDTERLYFEVPILSAIGNKFFIKAILEGGYSETQYAIAFTNSSLSAITNLSWKIVEPAIVFSWDTLATVSQYIAIMEDGGVSTIRVLSNPTVGFLIPKYPSSVVRIFGISSDGGMTPYLDTTLSLTGVYNYNEVVNVALPIVTGNYLNMAFTNANTVRKVSVLGSNPVAPYVQNINDADLYSFVYNLENLATSNIESVNTSWFREGFWNNKSGMFESGLVDLGVDLTGKLLINLKKTVTPVGDANISAYEHVAAEYLDTSVVQEIVDMKAFLSAKITVRAADPTKPWRDVENGDWVTDVRYVKMVVSVMMASPLTDITVTALNVTLDTPDVMEFGSVTDVTTSGKTVACVKKFNHISAILCTVRGNTNVYTNNVSTTDFNVYVGAGTQQVDYMIKGY